jgi:hypothetical protein
MNKNATSERKATVNVLEEVKHFIAQASLPTSIQP